MPEGGEQPKKTNGCLIAAGVVAGLMVLGALLPKAPGESAAGGGSAAPATTAPALAVSAEELRAAYAANEVAAKARFDGQVLEVSGRIASLDLDLMDNPVLVFEGRDPFSRVQAGFDKAQAGEIAALRKGAAARVRCEKVSEIAGTPMLDQCALVK